MHPLWKNENNTAMNMHAVARQTNTHSPRTWTSKESIGQLMFLKIRPATDQGQRKVYP